MRLKIIFNDYFKYFSSPDFPPVFVAGNRTWKREKSGPGEAWSLSGLRSLFMGENAGRQLFGQSGSRSSSE